MKEVPKLTFEVTFDESPSLHTDDNGDVVWNLNKSNISELIEALEKIRDEE